MENKLVHYILGIADSNLILGQRLGELCGHGPNLETDIALTNISLDLFGQVRSYYQYAASILGGEATEDSLAFLRLEHEYRSAILCQLPNTDFAYVIVRQFLFDAYHILLVESLVKSSDETLSAIAQKAVKEVRYHRRF
jgi:ring-1,2-phenylacetyl-CoA epoxidase subunit PaaC